ncbi:acyl transferase/acyl hydrolase/lysophospholipase [Lipomyces arxii]|uniref:acyl transferase/acyl hydrolase/lysophospholipase n=1 Tax=Lipomyces arxii TaxID=56418 RepID=UPI0034CE9C3C
MSTFFSSVVDHVDPDLHISEDVNNSRRAFLSSVTSNLARAAGKFYKKVSDRPEHELHNKRLEVARVLQRHASSYEEWARASQELDFLYGYDSWKSNPVSEEYDYKSISERVAEMRTVRESEDYLKLLFMLRTTLTRNPGNIGNTKLYLHSNIGTKYLIDDYIGECEESLKIILHCKIPAANSGDEVTYLDDHTKLDELLRTRHAFGRTALLLSGGGTMGMLHSGVVQALLECSLLPKIISGSSAGAIVASALCTRTDSELPELLDSFTYFNLDVFEETNNEESIWTRIARFLKHGAWTDISYLVASMREVLGDITFQEAYNRTRRVLNIPVSSASVYEPPRLLNYLTAPNVYIWSAVCASCSVPLIFSSHTLLAKDPRTHEPVPWNPSSQRWIDGSVDNDLPMTRLNEMFNVNHFIVSQVNPHVIPFLKQSIITPDITGATNTLANSAASLVSSAYSAGAKHQIATGLVTNLFAKFAKLTDTAMQLAVSETMHRLLMTSELGFMPNLCTKLRSVLAQTYSGDITILPEVYVSELPRILKNPTPEFLLDAKARGRRATWPKVSIIRNHCAIELALDAAIIELRSRTIFNAMVVGARKLSFPYSYFQQHQQSVLRWTRRRSHDQRRDGNVSVSSFTSLPAQMYESTSSLGAPPSLIMPDLSGHSSNLRARPGSSRTAGQVTIVTPDSEQYLHDIQPFDGTHSISIAQDDVSPDDFGFDSEMEMEEGDEGDEEDSGEGEDGSDEGYMMGVFPEDTDFDIGSPVERMQEPDTAYTGQSPSSQYPPRVLQRPFVGRTNSGFSPPNSPYHQRRSSGGNDGYYYNYFNYTPAPSNPAQNGTRSQPSTPGPGLSRRNGSSLNISAQTRYTRPRGATMTSGVPSSSTVYAHAQSLQSSPRARMRTYSDLPTPLTSAHGSSPHQQNSLSMALPPSLDADSGSLKVLSLSRRPSAKRRNYWPLQYETASALIMVPGIPDDEEPLRSGQVTPPLRVARSLSSVTTPGGESDSGRSRQMQSTASESSIKAGGHVVDVLNK